MYEEEACVELEEGSPEDELLLEWSGPTQLAFSAA